jgi:selenocysteine-specific elongation factor
MIIGTAGHVDHGKTTLVRALTGVDTDRLPEEKRRGMSIELGYAYLDQADPGSGAPRRLAFIDVPGHERLLHTMLAGASGIEHALLLVAADDGVMPQTREHAAVLALLGIERGTIVITKCDRVDAARIDEVARAVRELLAPTPLAAAPILPVSALAGTGIEALKARLLAAGRETAPRDASRGFRVAIDRVFTLAGVGTVVTGTAHDGEVRVGDELEVQPAGHRVRVRGLRAQNAAVAVARAGDRCALALTGVAKDELGRGQWLCAPSIACASARIDVLLHVWPGEPAALRTSTTVHVHLGTSNVLATVVLLAADLLLPRA